MKTINDVISMKKKKNRHFGTQYRWLIKNIENDLISKSNGSEKVPQLLSDYDETAKVFIVHQFMNIGEEQLARELLSALEIDVENTLLENKYVDELLDSKSFY